MFFCTLLKKSIGNPNILDVSQLFVADAPVKKKIQQFSFTTPQRIFVCLAGKIAHGQEESAKLKSDSLFTIFPGETILRYDLNNIFGRSAPNWNSNRAAILRQSEIGRARW